MSVTLATALKIFRNREAARLEWQEQYARECEADRRNGHRPSHCPHGAYLWVEWDVICGPCEDGEPTPADLRADAIYSAKRYEADMEKLIKSLFALHSLKVISDRDLGTMIADGSRKLREKYDVSVSSDSAWGQA